MKISDKLAGLNTARFADWQPDFSPANARQALLAFKGMSIRGWRWKISARQISTSPRHTCACSPVSTGCCARSDLMMSYRLEMGIRLNNARGKDLYQFWGDIITAHLNKALAARETRC